MNKLQQLQSFLRKNYPALKVDIDEGKYGNAWLDLRLPKIFCVIGFVPRRGYSFDSVLPVDPWDGYGQNFSAPRYDFQTVKRKLLRVIEKELKPKTTPPSSRRKQIAAA